MRDATGKFMAKEQLSTADRIKQLREEANRLEQERAGELRSEIDGLIAELNEITGENFQLSQSAAAAPQPTSGKKGRKAGTKMSEEAKAKMAAAAQKRWADKKAASQSA